MKHDVIPQHHHVTTLYCIVEVSPDMLKSVLHYWYNTVKIPHCRTERDLNAVLEHNI